MRQLNYLKDKLLTDDRKNSAEQYERYVKDGKIITSAGVSAGINISLYLLSSVVNENYAKVVQLGIEYDPKPPFDSGSPEKHLKK